MALDLQMTPEDVMNKANQLSIVAENLDKQVTELGNKVEEMTGVWTGMASNAFYNMYVRMEDALRGFPKILEGIAQEAKGSAKAIDSTDDALAQQFRG
jgi:WXG100 family type VII secretion target